MFDMFAFKITVSITCFENDALKLSVNEANFRGFRARNCATIEQVLILNFALPHLSRNVLLSPPPPTNSTDIGGCYRLRQIGPS